jgi:hypothetical protein
VTPEEALMAQLKEIIDGAGQALDEARKTEHLKAMPYLAQAAQEAISHKETSHRKVHLFAIQEIAKDSLENPTLIDGTPASQADRDNPDMIGAEFSYVHAFDDGEDALAILTDPETAVAFEGTMPEAGVFMVAETKTDRFHALFAANALVVRKFIGAETVTYTAEPSEQTADDFFRLTGLGDDAQALVKGLVEFRSSVVAFRQQHPTAFQVMYERWKDKMRKAQEGDD